MMHHGASHFQRRSRVACVAASGSGAEAVINGITSCSQQRRPSVNRLQAHYFCTCLILSSRPLLWSSLTSLQPTSRRSLVSLMSACYSRSTGSWSLISMHLRYFATRPEVAQALSTAGSSGHSPSSRPSATPPAVHTLPSQLAPTWGSSRAEARTPSPAAQVSSVVPVSTFRLLMTSLCM